jgi:Negative regulator of sigma F
VNADCEAFVKALGERGPSTELAIHAAHCAQCKPVWEVDQALRHQAKLPPAPPMAAELQRLLFEHRPAPYATSFWARALAVLAVVTASFGLVLLCVPRADLGAISAASLLGPIAPLASLLLLGLGLFAYRGKTGLGIAPWLRWTFSIGAVFAYELVTALELHASPGETGLAPERDCLFVGAAVAFAVAAVSCGVSRRTALISPGASGALAGSIAGLAAILGLHVHCPSLLATHLTLVHVVPLLLAIGGGLYAGRRWLAV